MLPLITSTTLLLQAHGFNSCLYVPAFSTQTFFFIGENGHFINNIFRNNFCVPHSFFTMSLQKCMICGILVRPVNYCFEKRSGGSPKCLQKMHVTDPRAFTVSCRTCFLAVHVVHRCWGVWSDGCSWRWCRCWYLASVVTCQLICFTSASVVGSVDATNHALPLLLTTKCYPSVFAGYMDQPWLAEVGFWFVDGSFC